jgi:hypothetical protein
MLNRSTRSVFNEKDVVRLVLQILVDTAIIGAVDQFAWIKVQTADNLAFCEHCLAITSSIPSSYTVTLRHRRAWKCRLETNILYIAASAILPFKANYEGLSGHHRQRRVPALFFF